MDHPINHSSNFGSIRQDEGLIQSLEPKALDSLSLVFGPSDPAPFPPDCNRLLLFDLFSFLRFFHASYPEPLREPLVG